MVQLTRYKNWLKQPLSVNAPPTVEAQKYNPILHRILFSNDYSASDITSVCDKFNVNPTIINREQLPITSIYSISKPEPLRGKQLFHDQFCNFNKHLYTKYSTLSEPFKKKFQDDHYVNLAYREKLRNWQEYEIIQFLKRYSNCKWNPYIYLNLKPWEIILDKLDGSSDFDYYDQIIKEAFSLQKINLYKSVYLEGKQDDFSCLKGRKSSVFHLTTTQHDYHHQKTAANFVHQFFLRLKPLNLTLGYNQFMYELSRDFSPEDGILVQVALEKWRSLSEQQRDQYKIDAPTRAFMRLQKRSCKLAMVLHYIYDVCNNGSFDWRINVPWDKVYANGYYLDHYFFVERNFIKQLDLTSYYSAWANR